ncbi:MAG TPA: hypothetical protein VGW11_09505 [Solirubrobacteraceae bacterium]|nr:hypothetical protein [Solirubrobacteraceae bacterium]
MPALRLHPHRGDVLAAGAVLLAVGVAVADLRLGGAWAGGVRFGLLSGPAALAVLAMGLAAPAQERPRPYVTLLLLVALGLTALALSDLADALGDEGRLASPAATTFVSGCLAAMGLVLAWTRGSATVTLTACVAGTVTLLATADLGFQLDDRLEAFRYLLCAALLVFILAASATRDRHRHHAVSFVEAGGLALVAVGATLAAERLPEFAPVGPLAQGTGAGWEAVLLLGGWALLAYAAVDRERGPAWLGVVVLALFTGLAGTGEDASLLWWPVILLALGAAIVAFGLRQATQLPSEPHAAPKEPPAQPTPMPARRQEPAPWEEESPAEPAAPTVPAGDAPQPPSPLWSGGEGGHER